MNGPGEAKITINGVELNFAQSMTVRVAIESFAISLGDFGEDEPIRKAYEARLTEIRIPLYAA